MAEMGLILVLGMLLAVGFAMSRLAGLLHLPGIMGYILVGIVFGPMGFKLIGTEGFESSLKVFTNIALMLVAFGIGERFDLRELRYSAGTLARVSFSEILATFVLVAVGVGLAAWLAGVGSGGREIRQVMAIGLVCAAIAVATAPAATMAVLRELGARGPVSNMVTSGIVVNNAFSIVLFGMMVALAQVLLETGAGTGIVQLLLPLSKTILSLALGIAVGLGCDYIVHHISGRDDILVVALATVLLVGGLAAALGLSYLLAGVAAGFAVVNRDRRDVRAFRALNDFEPPLYGIFFALAGAELQLEGLLAAGALSMVFVIMRAAGKYAGVRIGGKSAKMDPRQAKAVGLSLLPQAGLAVGLAYLVRQDATLAAIQTIVIDLVMASVIINELVGAPLMRFAMIKADEATRLSDRSGKDNRGKHMEVLDKGKSPGVGPAPWPQKPLEPPEKKSGYVLICVSHPATVRALTRLGTLLSHHYSASPMALHVTRMEEDDYWGEASDEQAVGMFAISADEARILGYKMHTEVETTGDLATGIISTASDHNAKAIIMGHAGAGIKGVERSDEVVKNITDSVECPVVVAKFLGPLEGGRILVPCTDLGDIDIVRPVVRALGLVSKHTITVLKLMPPESRDDELKGSEKEIHQVCVPQLMAGELNIRAVAAESREHKILEAAGDHDMLIMAIRKQSRLSRAFFGSLAHDIAEKVNRTVLFVYGE